MQLEKEKKEKRERERCRALAQRIAEEANPASAALLGEQMSQLTKALHRAGVEAEEWTEGSEAELLVVADPAWETLPETLPARVLLVSDESTVMAGWAEQLAQRGYFRDFGWRSKGRAQLVESLFAKYDFDYVINFAAESHVDRSIKNPEIFVQSNVMGTVNLLQRAKEAWYDADAKTWKEGKKYLQVSTDEVYGALGAEGFFMETTPLCPHSPYSSSKASADMFVMAFHDTYGMPINITRCSNNYGPYQFPEKLIPLMINNVKHHKQLPVYGDGMQIRDWLYVEDHCKAIDMVCNGGKVGEVYNVGGHNERPNIFIVKTIIEQLHDRLKDDGISEDLIKHVADRLGHDRRYGIDPTKIKNDLGWYPETPFEKGIVLTIDWYLDHEEWMEHITSGNYQKYYEEMYKNK